MRKAFLAGGLALLFVLPTAAAAKGPEVAALTGSDIVLNDEVKLKEAGVDATAPPAALGGQPALKLLQSVRRP